MPIRRAFNLLLDYFLSGFDLLNAFEYFVFDSGFTIKSGYFICFIKLQLKYFRNCSFDIYSRFDRN